MIEQLYTLAEVSDIVKQSRRTLFDKIKTGKLKAFKLENNEWRVKERDLRAYINGK